MSRIGIGALLVCVCGIAACGDSTGNDTTALTLLLTDAPGDVLEAVVTIREIYLQGGSDSTSTSGRVILLSEPVTTDLLTLAGTYTTLVDAVEVPTGTYGQLRFVLDGAYLRIEDETGERVFATAEYAEAPAQVDGELLCPSCGQSGLKVTMSGDVTLDGPAQTLAVDFDVADSFGHEAGQSGQWVMHPSLRTTTPPTN
jgi:hypothetical protein